MECALSGADLTSRTPHGPGSKGIIMLDKQGNKTTRYNEIRRQLWGRVDNNDVDMHIRAILDGAYTVADAIRFQRETDSTGPDGQIY